MILGISLVFLTSKRAVLFCFFFAKVY